MNLCIPTESDDGLSALVSPHFGRAPYFTFVDTVTGNAVPMKNPGHGSVHPPDFVLGQQPDAVAVKGMGRGAYGRFDAAGVQVLRTEQPDVEETLAAAREGRLRPLPEEDLHEGGHG